ncbi:putative TraA protein (plasmid) [Caballeronia insecticola]|uniref:Putative TraA protein n=1 Tax=Caballeronia insecticola TaxID=758793 RepID=A0A060PH41_9BURK|nr:hypothetical protein [Caballeronia insecticola]BAO94102.1 putative TraA protein [Caballeronia insecticola]
MAGYKHLSKYIRDKAMSRDSQRDSARDSMETWAEQQELNGRLAEIERSQTTSHTPLAALLFLMRKQATTGEFNDLVLACQDAEISTAMPAELLAASSPELVSLIARLTEDS